MEYSTEETVWGRMLRKGWERQGWKWNSPETFRIGEGEWHTPDFYNEADMKVVELFGTTFHDARDEAKLTAFYRRNGWECLILWSWMGKETISEKLNGFLHGPIQIAPKRVEGVNRTMPAEPLPAPEAPQEPKPPVRRYSWSDPNDEAFDGQLRKMY